MSWEAAIPLITAGVGMAGQIAASRQAGRQAQAQQQVPVDRLNQDAATSTLGVQQRALDAQDAAKLARALGMLQEAQAARQAPGQNASNSVRGDILANAQDAEFSGSSRIPKHEFSGGLRPSMFSGNTRQLGSQMSRDALLSQMNGTPTPFSDLPEADYSKILDAPAIPGGTALPEGGRLDSVLQAIGQYGGLAAGVMNGLNGAQGPAAGTPTAQQPTANYLQPGAMPGQVMSPAPPPVAAPMLAGRYIPGLNTQAQPAVTGRSY
jgi:hypothetical protein